MYGRSGTCHNNVWLMQNTQPAVLARSHATTFVGAAFGAVLALPRDFRPLAAELQEAADTVGLRPLASAAFDLLRSHVALRLLFGYVFVVAVRLWCQR